MTGTQKRLLSLSQQPPLTLCRHAHSPRLPLDRLVHSSILQTRERVWPAHAQQPNDRSALSIFAGFWAGPGKRYQRIILTVRTELTVQTAQTQRRSCLRGRSTKGIGPGTAAGLRDKQMRRVFELKCRHLQRCAGVA